MKKLYILSLLILMTANDLYAQTPTKPEGLQHGDYIIVWHCGGMARGRYIGFYCLTDAGLSYDTSRKTCLAPKDINELNLNYKLPGKEYAKVKDMPLAISPEMLSNNNKLFGKQAIDGGQFHVLAYLRGTAYHWSFTGPLDQFSPEVQKFAAYIYRSL